MAEILELVDFSKLAELSICESSYDPNSERALARKVGQFTESLVIELDEFSSEHYTENDGRSRTSAGFPDKLTLSRVKHMDDVHLAAYHYRFLQPILPVHSW